MLLKKGVRVRHPGKPEWGVGEVLEDCYVSEVRIFFVGHGEIKLSLEHVSLIPVTGPEANHPVLNNLRIVPGDKGARYLSLPRSISRFQERYPQGFYGEKYLEAERDYKVKAHTLCLELLGEKSLSQALQGRQFDDICTRALRVVNATNLIFPNEKMALKDGLRNDRAKELFSEALYALLYGTTAFESRFEAFASVLGDIGAAKWTTATYFPFLALPETHIFLKPEVTKNVAELSAFEINYRPEVNWLTYKCVLEFAGYLRNALADLKPRDMIDVQSFIWCNEHAS